MKLYQTDNMEHALIHMIARYDKAIVFNRHYCKRRIPFRKALVKGVPHTTTNPYGALFDLRLQKWNRKRGILYYRPHAIIDKMPACDALLFIEAPLSYRIFHQYIDRISRDVVIYRPPNWEFQEEMLNARLPTSGDLEAFLAVIEGWNTGAISGTEERLLWATGFSMALSQPTVDLFLGFDRQKVVNLFKRGFQDYFRWYVPYHLPLEPDEPDLLETYNALKSQLLEGRFLRSNRFDGNQLHLTFLFRKGYINCGDPIYILKKGYRPPDLHLLDAVNNARRADWYKMKLIVEGAEPYSISI
jgi:hypothetical protein